jgi:polyisoprenoid-binding protein YceI
MQSRISINSKNWGRPLILAVMLLFPLTVAAQRVEYQVDTKAKNNVKFISDAPVEDFEGVTSKIDGYLVHDGEEVSAGSELYFEVDLRTLDTGIGLRNRHMREDYLHTDKYPYAKYSGNVSKAWKSGKGTEVMVSGNMDIHGKKKALDVRGVITPVSNGIRIKTSFEVKLTDHNIEVPQLMFVKISEVMKLELDFHLKRVKG